MRQLGEPVPDRDREVDLGAGVALGELLEHRRVGDAPHDRVALVDHDVLRGDGEVTLPLRHAGRVAERDVHGDLVVGPAVDEGEHLAVRLGDARVDLDEAQALLLLVPHELGVEAAVVEADVLEQPTGDVPRLLLDVVGHRGSRVVDALDAQAARALEHVEDAVHRVLAPGDAALGRELGAPDDLLREAGGPAESLQLLGQLDRASTWSKASPTSVISARISSSAACRSASSRISKPRLDECPLIGFTQYGKSRSICWATSSAKGSKATKRGRPRARPGAAPTGSSTCART